MTRAEWKQVEQKIKRLPKGTTYQQAADRLGLSYHRARILMVRCGRQIKTPRKRLHLAERARTHAKYFHLPWDTMSISQLGRQVGLSRQRMHQLRIRFGKPFVDGRKRNGK